MIHILQAYSFESDLDEWKNSYPKKSRVYLLQNVFFIENKLIKTCLWFFFDDEKSLKSNFSAQNSSNRKTLPASFKQKKSCDLEFCESHDKTIGVGCCDWKKKYFSLSLLLLWKWSLKVVDDNRCQHLRHLVYQFLKTDSQKLFLWIIKDTKNIAEITLF